MGDRGEIVYHLGPESGDLHLGPGKARPHLWELDAA